MDAPHKLPLYYKPAPVEEDELTKQRAGCSQGYSREAAGAKQQEQQEQQHSLQQESGQADSAAQQPSGQGHQQPHQGSGSGKPNPYPLPAAAARKRAWLLSPELLCHRQQQQQPQQLLEQEGVPCHAQQQEAQQQPDQLLTTDPHEQWQPAPDFVNSEQRQHQSEGWDASWSSLQHVIAQRGPFDGVLGFSQVRVAAPFSIGYSGKHRAVVCVCVCVPGVA